MSKPSEALAAFALVAEEVENSGDPIKGLKPLFAPILHGKSGQEYSPANFSEEFVSRYGLQMTPFVARALAERLCELGLLEERHTDSKGVSFWVADFEWQASPVHLNEMEETVGLFVAWASSEVREAKKSISDEQLEDAILSRLARPEFSSAFFEDNKGSRFRALMGVAGLQQSPDIDAYLDYLVASFVIKASEKAPLLMESLARISYGALIADAVSGLAVPSSGLATEPPLRVVLDAPLILDILDLNTNEYRDYAASFLDLLKSSGFRLAVFDHSIDEARRTIRTTIAAHQNGYGHGPMAHRFRITPAHKTYASVVADTLEKRISDLGLTILRSGIYEEARFKRWFDDDLLDRVRNSIGDLHEKIDARISDAKSVATIARLKGEAGTYRATTLFEAGSIFATRNSVLCKRVLRVLSAGTSDPTPSFCIATDGQLAGVLWFVSGITGLELSRRRLIANCSASVLPKQEVIKKIATYLEGLSPELKDEFKALMMDGRASLCPMRLTAGDANSVDQDGAVEILKAMRAELSFPMEEKVHELQLEAIKERAHLSEEISKQKEVVSVLQDVLEKSDERAEDDRRRFDFEVAQLKHELDSTRFAQDAIQKKHQDGLIALISKLEEEEEALNGLAESILRIFIYVACIILALSNFIITILPELEGSNIRIPAALLSFAGLGLGILLRKKLLEFVKLIFVSRRNRIAALKESLRLLEQ